MKQQWRELVEAACRAREHAHAPYSRFRVGAALLGESGRVHAAGNVENASYGLSMCAERCAVGLAVAAGERRFTAVAVCTDTEAPTPPCGACRQVLQEFAAPELVVLLAGRDGNVEQLRLADLLPRPFLSFRPDPDADPARGGPA